MNKSALFRPYPQIAALLLRISCGLFFVPHVWYKLANLSGSYALFGKMGFDFPELFVWMAIIIESVAAIGLIFNLYVRWIALLSSGTLFIAIFGLYNLKGGFFWLWNIGGIEYPIFWGIACLVIALNTAGSPAEAS